MKAIAASEAINRVHAKKSPPPMAAAGLLGPYLVSHCGSNSVRLQCDAAPCNNFLSQWEVGCQQDVSCWIVNRNFPSLIIFHYILGT